MKNPPKELGALLASLCLSLLFACDGVAAPGIVINELHIDEDDKTRRGEFIELYNNSGSDIDVSGWFFSSGINQAGSTPSDPAEDFVIPNPTSIPARGYLVIAQDPAEMVSLFGYAGALGPWVGKLSNRGETVTLNDSGGNVIDEVTYQLGWPWPTVGDPPSPSMELINPDLDNDLGGSWRSSGNIPASSLAPAEYILREDTQWHYRKGITFPSNDVGGDDWTKNGYDENDDGEWLISQAPFGRGDDDDNTVLADQGSYISFFMRHEFDIAAGQVPSTLTFRALYDDGLAIWINGVEVHRYSLDPGAIPFPPPDDFASSHEADDIYEEVTVSGAASYLVEGTNTIAVQLINERIGSSDSTADVEVVFTGSTVETDPIDPSPGAANSVFAINAPPAVRQVDHLPEQPSSGQPVVVTAKITDPDGVGAVALAYQLVDPGDYFCRYQKFNSNGTANVDPRYEDPAEWTTVTMSDDGSGGDALAADSIYTATLPGTLQTNRRLVRYRISAEDSPGTGITVPYSDDPQPNFAYFVYDGTPDWSGVIRPGDTPVNHPGSLMSSVPTYFLLSTNAWVDDSQFGGYRGSEYLWPGTMVYDGKVYDHIQYRPRGGVHRFQYGKNFWKFDFNRGHRFQARDNYGKKYKTQWNKLNFSSIVQQNVHGGKRGEQGLFEGVGFRLFSLAGVEACNTHYTQFYVIDNASPTGADQYESDYYGLFLAIEQMDGQYLDEHGLPDGNLYKIEGYNGDSNNQGPTQPDDRSDVTTFINAYRNGTPTAQWWSENLDIEKYLSYRTIVEGIHHYDIAQGKNYFYYHNPDTGLFEMHPWDLDLTWADDTYGDGNHDFKSKVAENPAFNTGYQNRVREIMDLLYNDDEGYHVIDETVRHVWMPDQPSLIGADRRLWDNNPRINNPDLYYDFAANNEFSGMIQLVRNYIVSRGSWMEANLLTNESNIPDTPVISHTGIASFPATDLSFSTTSYNSPGGSAFAAMEWRLSEVYNPDVPNYVAGEPYVYEIENPFESGELAPFTSTYTFPFVSARPGLTYRARVRHKDAAGRWSHWSDAIEFTVTAPDVSFFQQSLVISEFMYHPADATAAELALGFSNSDFEWIEVRNVGDQAVDMTNLRFTKGVDFDFPDSYIIPVDGYVILARSLAGFEHRYGNSHPVVGEYAPDNLSNSEENLKLSFAAGTPIIEFIYSDLAPWPTGADGDGFSLVLIDPESVPDHSDPANWRTSAQVGGNPGTDDALLTFAEWKTATGVTGNENDDDDLDRFSNLLEFATGSDGTDPTSINQPIASVQTIDASDYLFFSFRKLSAAGGLTYTIEISPDLAAWEPLDAIFVASVPNGDGTTTETWRSTQSVTARSGNFARLHVSN